MVETQQLVHQEAEVDIEWATTGMCFLKGVHLLVHPIHPLAPHPPPTAVIETAATKGIDGGKMLFHINFLEKAHLTQLVQINYIRF